MKYMKTQIDLSKLSQSERLRLAAAKAKGSSLFQEKAAREKK